MRAGVISVGIVDIASVSDSIGYGVKKPPRRSLRRFSFLGIQTGGGNRKVLLDAEPQSV